ncbi:MAG: hypothetical protein NVSMB27_21710 [Ktedonobacteraceae bacterium]
MSGQEPLVSARQFGYRYHQDDPWVLRDLNMHLGEGEWLLLMGASGSGKSTFARVLNGIIPHFYGGQITGNLNVCGIDPAETPMSTTFRRVGCLFQDPTTQFLRNTVERELSFGLESSGLSIDEVRTRVINAAQRTGITHLLHRTPQTLSGGEQQLVLLTAFLAIAPQLLVLDEPLSMLDARARQRIVMELQRAHTDGIGLFVIDHQIDSYGYMPTGIALMNAGTINTKMAPAVIGATLLQQSETAVALPAATLWWTRYVLPVLKQQSDSDTSVPLDIETVQKQLTCLPVAALQAIHSTIPRIVYSEDVQSRIRLSSAGQAPLVEWINVGYTYSSSKRESTSKHTHQPTKKALHDINAALWPGEIVAVLGPNGAGKSTLLKTLNGLIRPQQGEVRIGGERTGNKSVAELAHVSGYAPQRPERLFFCSTVAQELAAGPRAMGISTTETQKPLIDAFALNSLLERSPYTLSLGEQRRAGLAAVLASQPQVIALDEPTVGLDASARRALAILLRAVVDRGAVVVMVTHDIEFASATASRWLVLVDGRLVANDTPAHIMANAEVLKEAALEPSADYQLAYWLDRRVLIEQAPRNEH